METETEDWTRHAEVDGHPSGLGSGETGLAMLDSGCRFVK